MIRGMAILLGIVAASLAWTAAVLADGGPHGSYTSTTDGCAGCHRTHTASAPKLLVNTNTALCLTCHGAAGTGAETNVSDGVYEGTTMGTQGAGLNGGGFANALQDTGLTGAPTTGAVTSTHAVEGTPGYSSTAIMWGAGTGSGAGAGTAFDLYCTSCHDPHGNSNYRMLKSTVNGVPVAVAPTDDSAKSYTTPSYYKPASGTGQWEISAFCAACHTRYMAGAGGSGETPSGDPIFQFAHRIDAPSGSSVGGVTYSFPAGLNLPVSTVNGGAPYLSPDNRSMVCVTCHYSHGSKATMGTNSGGIPWPGGDAGPSGNGRSSLLRLDNRGVCQNCHPK